MTEGFRTTIVAFAVLGAGLTWQALRTAMIPVNAPDRLVSELRLAQMAALLLALSAGAYIGLAVAHEAQPGVGFDVALAVGFFVAAATTLVRDPRQALTILALAFAAHAVLDVGAPPGLAAARRHCAPMVLPRLRALRRLHRRAVLLANSPALSAFGTAAAHGARTSSSLSLGNIAPYGGGRVRIAGPPASLVEPS